MFYSHYIKQEKKANKLFKVCNSKKKHRNWKPWFLFIFFSKHIEFAGIYQWKYNWSSRPRRLVDRPGAHKYLLIDSRQMVVTVIFQCISESCGNKKPKKYIISSLEETIRKEGKHLSGQIRFNVQKRNSTTKEDRSNEKYRQKNFIISSENKKVLNRNYQEY